MSIQTDLTRLQSAKAAIKAAIEGKGVTVPEATLLDGMASLIDSIEAGGGSSAKYLETSFTLAQDLKSNYMFPFDISEISLDGEDYSTTASNFSFFINIVTDHDTGFWGGAIFTEGSPNRSCLSVATGYTNGAYFYDATTSSSDKPYYNYNTKQLRIPFRSDNSYIGKAGATYRVIAWRLYT